MNPKAPTPAPKGHRCPCLTHERREAARLAKQQEELEHAENCSHRKSPTPKASPSPRATPSKLPRAKSSPAGVSPVSARMSFTGFKVPEYSSSPPSTPDRKERHNAFDESNMSTTPAGAPPSSAGSFTPAGPPPSSFMGSSTRDLNFNSNPYGSEPPLPPGSSLLGSSNQSSNASSNASSNNPNPFGQQHFFKHPNPTFHGPMSSPSTAPMRAARKQSTLRHEYKPASERLGGFQVDSDDEEEDEDEEHEHDHEDAEGEYEDEDAHGRHEHEHSEDDDMREQHEHSEDDDMQDQHEQQEDDAMGEAEEEPQNPGSPQFTSPTQDSSMPTQNPPSPHFGSSIPSFPWLGANKTTSQPGTRNSAAPSVRNIGGDLNMALQPVLEHPKPQSFGKIARDLSDQLGNPEAEPDDVILSTEGFVSRMYREGIAANQGDDRMQEVLSSTATELVKSWAVFADQALPHRAEEYTAEIGPNPQAPDFNYAFFIASLLVPLYQPPASKPSRPLDVSFTTGFRSLALREPVTTKSVGLVALEWLEQHHVPYPGQLDEVRTNRPSPAAHGLFWEVILSSIVRGKVDGVIRVLETAGWENAKVNSDEVQEGSSLHGYTGAALKNVKRVVLDAVNVLKQCPGVKGEWNPNSSEWTLFRLRATQAHESLKEFAEGKKRDDNTDGGFQAVNFGVSQSAFSMTSIAKKAESQVPWTVYQNLCSLYEIIQGEATPIISNSNDWCEATIGLMAWGYDAGEYFSEGPTGRMHVHDPSSRVTEIQRLARSFQRAIAPSSELKVNSQVDVEVALATVFEGDIEGAVGFLRAWSGSISSAVVDLASLGGWLRPADAPSLIDMDSLDEDDMDILGFNVGGRNSDSVKDATLISYAQLLTQIDKLTPSQNSLTQGGPEGTREGWEIALEVLGRLDSAPRSEEVVGDLINSIRLDTSDRVDKLWRALSNLAMTTHAERISATYADSLSESTHNYGEALWFYALAHNRKAVKDVLNLLTSFCLIHSTSFPPVSELDATLHRLITSPSQTLQELARLDLASAELLHELLAGYATLRLFYDHRDALASSSPGAQKMIMAKDSVREACLPPLLAVINSSAYAVHGGLFDPARNSSISTDFLLVLLGEVLPFLSPSRPLSQTLSVSQINMLLKVIEDIQTVIPGSIYTAASEFFDTALASAQGLKGSSPADLLRSRSGMSGMSGMSGSMSGTFSLVNSGMLASQMQRSMSSGSAVFVGGKDQIRRGWDWRQGLRAGTKAEDVLRVLRLGLASELAGAWVREVDGSF